MLINKRKFSLELIQSIDSSKDSEKVKRKDLKGEKHTDE